MKVALLPYAPTEHASGDKTYKNRRSQLPGAFNLGRLLQSHPQKRPRTLERTDSCVEFKPAAKASPYVPRYAARSFKSSTTTDDMVAATASNRRRSGSEQVKRSSREPLEWDENTGANQKLLLMARSIGMSESEAYFQTAKFNQDTADHHNAVQRRASKVNRHASVRDTTNTYLADTTRRARPMSTALDNLDPTRYTYMGPIPSNPYVLAIPEIEQDDARPRTLRPNLKASDRNDWAQASQAGDGAHRVLHMKSLRRKDKEDSEARSNATKPTEKPRSSSHGHIPSISEAVRLVKQGEKQKRRSSLLGFFHVRKE